MGSHHRAPLFRTSLAVVCGLLAVCGMFRAPKAKADDTPAANPLDSYKTATIGGAVFKYPREEQAFVNAIAASYTFPIQLIDQKNFEGQMDYWKQHGLELITKSLGLQKPADAMNKAFEQFRDTCQPIIKQGIGEVRVYYSADLRKALAQGAKVEGITAPNGNTLSIADYIGVERVVASGTDAKPAKEYALALPIILSDKKSGDVTARMRVFDGALRDMRWRVDDTLYKAYCECLYEIARPEILACISKARAHPWFVEGMTNAIPLLVMRSYSPSSTLEQTLRNLKQFPPNFEKIAAGMDLDTWPSTHAQDAPKGETEIYSYFALLVTLDAIQKNGEDWLPGFFQRLRQENNPALAMPDVYAIFNEVSKQDLHDSIARVKEELAAGK